AIWCIRHRDKAAAGSWRRRIQPLALFVVTAVMFALLPFRIPGWWAVNIRLIPFIVAFAIVAIPASRRRLPWTLLAPAACGAIVWGGYLAWDFHAWFNRVEMAGFNET